MNADEWEDVVSGFEKAVNLSPREIERWLETEASKAVGAKKNGGESVGHRSGRRIVRILQKDASAYTPADLAHMRKVSGYVKRHTAQRPEGDVSETPWRYSLMNWGHDPLKSD